MLQVEDSGNGKDYQNIGGLIGTLVAARMATLNELKTIYSLEDAMDMYEAYIIPRFNEWKSMKQLESKK